MVVMSIAQRILLFAAPVLLVGCGTAPLASQPPTATLSARATEAVTPSPSAAEPAETTAATPDGTATASAQDTAEVIAFADDEAGVRDVWVMNADGSERRRVTQSAQDRVAIPNAWSPDGEQIAYAIGPPSSELYAFGIVNADGTGQRDFEQGIGATWSPDGTQLVFQDPSFTAPQIYVMDVPDGEPRVLTSGGSAVWSPDGAWVAFNTQPEQDQQQVAVIAPDGSALRELVPGYAPSWSPDGTDLTYFTGSASGAFEVRVVGVDGSRDRPLAAGEQPRWSPDGSRIAFLRADPTQQELQLWVAAADGTGEPVQLPIADYDFAWSPDGTRIAVGADDDGDGTSEIHVMAADGSSDEVIGPGDVPVWRPMPADG